MMKSATYCYKQSLKNIEDCKAKIKEIKNWLCHFFIIIFNTYIFAMYTKILEICKLQIIATYINIKIYENMWKNKSESEIFEPLSPFNVSVEEKMKCIIERISE